MATTMTNILIHICFSTKHREDLIPRERFVDLAAYTGGICRHHESSLLSFGGTANHVHLLVLLGKTISLADLMLPIKRDSSIWLRKEIPRFGWQDGYFAFSIGESMRKATHAYLARQEKHHKTVDFRDEMRAFCKKHDLEIKEQYAWR